MKNKKDAVYTNVVYEDVLKNLQFPEYSKWVLKLDHTLEIITAISSARILAHDGLREEFKH